MDNGRLNITNYLGVVLCDAYLDDEWTVEDVHALVNEIHDNFAPQVDIIIRKTGSYSITNEAQALLETNLPELNRVVYVVDTPTKRSSVEYAKKSYMRTYNIEVASTLEEALKIIKGS